MKAQNIDKAKFYLPWLLFLIVTFICSLYWLVSIDWSIPNINISTTFPVLGIYAWSLMWTHYIISANRLINTDIQKNILYSKVTSILVLLLIILHPSLLAWQQWSFTSVLPPNSFYNYVGDSLKIFVLMGSLSLALFISFDILEKFKNHRIIKNNWKYISLSQMFAMILIFIHGLSLGSLMENSLMELYWLTLGLSLIPCFGLIIKNDWNKNSAKAT